MEETKEGQESNLGLPNLDYDEKSFFLPLTPFQKVTLFYFSRVYVEICAMAKEYVVPISDYWCTFQCLADSVRKMGEQYLQEFLKDEKWVRSGSCAFFVIIPIHLYCDGLCIKNMVKPL